MSSWWRKKCEGYFFRSMEEHSNPRDNPRLCGFCRSYPSRILMTSELVVFTHSKPEFGNLNFRFWYHSIEHNTHSKDQIHAKNRDRHTTLHRPMCRRIHHRKSRTGKEIQKLLVEFTGRSNRPLERTRRSLRDSNHQRTGGWT
jgi:hypothetical protein